LHLSRGVDGTGIQIMKRTRQLVPEVEQLGVPGVLDVRIDAQGLGYVHVWLVQNRYDLASVVLYERAERVTCYAVCRPWVTNGAVATHRSVSSGWSSRGTCSPDSEETPLWARRSGDYSGWPWSGRVGHARRVRPLACRDGAGKAIMECSSVIRLKIPHPRDPTHPEIVSLRL